MSECIQYMYICMHVHMYTYVCTKCNSKICTYVYVHTYYICIYVLMYMPHFDNKLYTRIGTCVPYVCMYTYNKHTMFALHQRSWQGKNFWVLSPSAWRLRHWGISPVLRSTWIPSSVPGDRQSGTGTTHMQVHENNCHLSLLTYAQQIFINPPNFLSVCKLIISQLHSI